VATGGGHAATLAFDAEGLRKRNDALLRLWRLEDGALEEELELLGPGGCALDPGGRYLALVNGGRLLVHDSAGPLRHRADHPTFVYDVRFAPDGKTLLTRDFEGTTRLWDARDLHLLSAFAAPTEEQRSFRLVSEPIAFHASGQRIVTLTRRGLLAEADLALDSQLRVREALDRTEFPVRRWLEALGGPRATRLATFDRRGRYLFQAAAVRDVASGEVLIRTGLGESDPDPGAYVRDEAAAFDPASRRVAVARPGLARVYDLGSRRVLADLAEDVPHRIWGLAWSPDGSRLAGGLDDGSVALWETDGFELLLRLRCHDAYVHDLDWSPDGTRLATASGDGTVRIWDSLPATRRLREAEEAAQLREALRPLVEELRARLGDDRAVAEHLRTTAELNADEQHEALLVLRGRD
jgi:WD40 repeat protein